MRKTKTHSHQRKSISSNGTKQRIIRRSNYSIIIIFKTVRVQEINALKTDLWRISRSYFCQKITKYQRNKTVIKILSTVSNYKIKFRGRPCKREKNGRMCMLDVYVSVTLDVLLCIRAEWV